jgi:hypothetical protein
MNGKNIVMNIFIEMIERKEIKNELETFVMDNSFGDISDWIY